MTHVHLLYATTLGRATDNPPLASDLPGFAHSVTAGTGVTGSTGVTAARALARDPCYTESVNKGPLLTRRSR